MLRWVVVLLLFATAVTGQTLESLARAYREKPTPARRDALLRYAAAHTKDANGALALFTIGVTEVEGKNFEEGARRLEAAKGRVPQLADYVSFFLGTAHFGSKKFEASIRELRSVWSRAPASPLAPRAALLGAQAHLESGAPEEAIGLLRSQYSRLPQPEGDLALATAYEAAGNLPSAAVYFQRVYYQFPSASQAAEAQSALSRLRASLGAAYRPPMAQAMLGRAQKWLEAGEYRRARAEFESSIPELGGAERELARVRIGVAEYLGGQTRTAYRHLQSLKPNAPEVDAERLYYLVACARRLDDLKKMLEFVDRLGKSHPQSVWRLKALVWAGNHYLLRNEASSYEPLFRACYQSFATDPQAAYCHWKVTWGAWLRRSPEAGDLFLEHLRLFPRSEKASAAVYFLGRLSEETRDPGTARTYYSTILDRFPNHYYAFLAEDRLKQGRVARAAVSRTVGRILEGVEFAEKSIPESFEPSRSERLRIQRARLLSSAGMGEWGERELRFEARADGQVHVLAMELAKLATRLGAPDRGIRHIKGVFPEYLAMPLDAGPTEFWRLAFPLPYRKELEKYSRMRKLDLFLLAGLIRQESEFNPKAISRARAHGLTQILPSTGRQLSRKLKTGRFYTGMLLRPDFNLRLGSYYFRTLLDQHDGNLEATLASFNGGKSRVEAWLTWAEYGEAAEFIETIPITETRNYVQSVLRNTEIYRRLYAGGASAVTSADGSTGRRASPDSRGAGN